ncbi:MAG: hypothetical protein PHF43_06460 [Bacteroidales bacterium]|nr:hypothetical protein [Bacteroidales bacterium]
MNDRKSQSPPQKRPQTWTDCQKSQVHPQKQPYMWMNAMNSDGCHNKASGASAYKKAPGSL